MINAPRDAEPAVIPVAEVAVSTGDSSSGTVGQTTFRVLRSENTESQFWTVTVPSYAGDRRGFVAMPVPETTHWDALCDLWAFPDELAPTPLDFGYGARLRDALRIRGDFNRAIAGLGLRERDVNE